jgi:uncharacterized protein (TIGR01777 family)
MSNEQVFQRSVPLPVSVEEAFAYHERPGALNRLVPPWEVVHVERSDGSLAVGSRVVLSTRILGIPFRWEAIHTRYEPPWLFCDQQAKGPFSVWQHEHRFEAAPPCCQLTDSIQYQLPGGMLGRLLGSSFARKKLERMFAYRHQTTRQDLQLFATHPVPPLQVAISGSNGLVGQNVTALLKLAGHSTRALIRGVPKTTDELAVWNDAFDCNDLEGMDAIVHLAGKSIGESRWNRQVKEEIRDSRVKKTFQLCERLAKLKQKPRVLLCASATGIYGDRGDEELTEASSLGDDFLATVGREWENACQPASDAGIRVVHLRFGIILSPRGGALAKMILPAKFLGGRLGSGRQWMSWISIDDCIGAIYHSMTNDALSGAVNVVAPHPVRNKEFAHSLGEVLGRPALFPAPAFALRQFFGEMTDSLLLASTRVQPRSLLDSGYQFRHSTLKDALGHLFGKPLSS